MVKLDDVDPHLYWEEKSTKRINKMLWITKHHHIRGKRIGRTGMALFNPPFPCVPATETFYAIR